MTKKRIAIIIIMILLTSFSSIVYAESRFDLRDYININVRNQGDTKTCWTIAMSTVFESTLAYKNGIKVQVSPRHMDYATSQSFINNEKNEFGFSRKVNSGGIAEFGLAYLTNGIGPVLETSMPFSEEYPDIDIREIQNKTFGFYVTDWIKFPTIIKKDLNTYVNNDDEQYTKDETLEIRNQVKNHIKNNGAIYAGINAEVGFSEYYNYDTFAYNCIDYTKEIDHAVVIIGWDDNFSRNNFKENCRPSSDGAYIVQNSWGNSSNLNNGIFYISYEDAIIESDVFGITRIERKDYSNIYQYDILGRNGYIGATEKGIIYGANVFQRNNIKNERISHVAINTHMMVDCEVYINPNGQEFDESKLIKIADKTLNPGYNTIYVKRDIELTSENFAIVIKCKKADKTLGFSFISQYDGNIESNAYLDIKSSRGESYIGTSLATLTDLYDKTINTSLCIKAFTNINVMGDMNNDNMVSALDLSMLMMHITGERYLENQGFADINLDGQITAIDLSKMKNIIVQ